MDHLNLDKQVLAEKCEDSSVAGAGHADVPA